MQVLFWSVMGRDPVELAKRGETLTTRFDEW